MAAPAGWRVAPPSQPFKLGETGDQQELSFEVTLPAGEATGWAVRVPVTLTPTNPWDIGGMRYPLTVSATYQVTGESQPRSFRVRAAVEAHVARAMAARKSFMTFVRHA